VDRLKEKGRFDALREAAKEDLEQTEAIGPEIARSVRRFFREAENRGVL
jgi:NAD-dependent DNA ligase